MASATGNTVPINEYQIFEWIINHTNKNTPNYPTQSQCRQQFAIHHQIKDNEHLFNFFKASWSRYFRLKKESFFRKEGVKGILERASKLFDHMEECIAEARSTSSELSKKRRKSFSDLGVWMQKERTESLLCYINNFIQNDCPELSMTQVLGYLVHRVNIQSEKNIAKVGYELFTGTANSHQSFELDEAIALMHSLTLSKDQMRKLRYGMASKGIYFPSSNELLDARKNLRPAITPVLDGKGVQVQYTDLVKMTVESVLNVVIKEKSMDEADVVEMTFKDGGDGAGQQVVWKSKSMIDSKENMFQYGITPLKLTRRRDDGTNDVLWENHTPNAPRTLRPLFLIRESETNPDLLKLVILKTDTARKQLSVDGVCAKVGDKFINVKIKIYDSMKDLKFKKNISGLGGADCILCITKQKDWSNREKVENGFPIERSAESTIQLYEKLVNKDGEIPRKTGDFETRQGMTSKPITTSDQMSITITHSYINGTTWFLKVLYRCHADHPQWIESTGPSGDPIRKSKEEVLKKIRLETGLILDQCSTAGSKGGTTTNGPQGRRFYSVELINTIGELVDLKYKENLLLHRQLSTILSVVSSSRKVALIKFKKLCDETSFNLCDNFPWVKINHTLHGTLHHSLELISLNDGYGLKNLSEECLEANNKDIRNYLQFLSRKTCPIDQLTDVMSRLLEHSDPLITYSVTQCQPQKYCTVCAATDHTIRSHSRLFNLPKQWYTSLVEDIFLD